MDIWSLGFLVEEIWFIGWLGWYLDIVVDGYFEGYFNEEYLYFFVINMGGNVLEICQGLLVNYMYVVYDFYLLNFLLEGEGSGLLDIFYGDELVFLC